MVLLIGNYIPDQQPSMLRFNDMMVDGLAQAGIASLLVRPPAVFGRVRLFGPTAAKWLGYIDKFVLFQWRLLRALRLRPAVVHICDHANAMFAPLCQRAAPALVTCHDMLAVRGAMGEATECPATFTGRFLQRWILRGLRSADAIACVSSTTAADVTKLVCDDNPTPPRVNVVPLGLSFPYAQIRRENAVDRLRGISGLEADKPFVLHVGSNTPRKNRDGVIRIFAKCAHQLSGQLVFAGEALTPDLHAQARSLGIAERLVEVVNAPSEVLEALYNCAHALLFPSRFEGFGWPIIEAQTCGCPVVCSSDGPMTEVAGAGALLHQSSDEEGFARDLLVLQGEERGRWIAAALQNARRFSTEKMIAEYRQVYDSLSAAA